MTDPHDVYLVVGPPRSASTALSRVIWNHPAIRYYLHEPYESSYFDGLDPGAVRTTADTALDLAPLTGAKDGAGLLIKEISFQIGSRLPELLARTAYPVVFIVRDPRLTVSSRRQVKRLQGNSPDFPLAETGWSDLIAQIDGCRERGVPHVVLDTSDFRLNPVRAFEAMFAEWGLKFDDAQLRWEPQPDLRLSNHRVGGIDHFFTRVLNSTGFEMPDEVPVASAEFPQENGLREHVRWATEHYERVRTSPHFLRVTA